MHFAASLLFAAGALALPKHECIVSSSADLAALSDCGDQPALARCLSTLQNASAAEVEACFADAGCPPEAAASEAQLAIDRCADSSRPDDLRRRFRAALNERDVAPATAAAMPVQELFAERTLAPRSASKGEDCFTTKTVNTKTCPLTTTDGKTTSKCTSTQAAKSECAPGLLCTHDAKGEDICMDLDNSLGIDGIIIAIVFAVAIALGIGYLTFMCCRDRRDQKRLAAKAEATALARAQTKKMRAQESRAPLMRQASGQAQGQQQPGADPFADGRP